MLMSACGFHSTKENESLNIYAFIDTTASPLRWYYVIECVLSIKH